jgi:predicted lipoprotein with Yx(FWY)xxD motif
MNGRGECADIRPMLGVYLTGAIAPADRAVFMRHLASCGGCREELAGLAALPGLLRRPPVQAAAGASEPSAGSRRPGAHALDSRGTLFRGMKPRRRRWLTVGAVVVLAAAAVTGWALRPGAPAARPAAAGNVLEPERIGAVTVLADAEGYTLYWFASDTAARSNCNGSCARSWPPVTGPAMAGMGVPGTLGWIKRSDGSVQATYNGHPLYTAAVDTVPGWVKGNDVRAAGGVWHEVTLSGPAPAARSGY